MVPLVYSSAEHFVRFPLSLVLLCLSLQLRLIGHVNRSSHVHCRPKSRVPLQSSTDRISLPYSPKYVLSSLAPTADLFALATCRTRNIRRPRSRSPTAALNAAQYLPLPNQVASYTGHWWTRPPVDPNMSTHPCLASIIPRGLYILAIIASCAALVAYQIQPAQVQHRLAWRNSRCRRCAWQSCD